MLVIVAQGSCPKPVVYIIRFTTKNRLLLLDIGVRNILSKYQKKKTYIKTYIIKKLYRLSEMN